MRTALLSLVMMIAITPFTSFGQIIKKYLPYPKPSVVLVRLPTYTERIAKYERQKDTRLAKQALKDAQNMQRVMVADFKNDFKFCSYYFFYDTSNTAILERDFAGRLYNKDLKLIDTNPIADGDTTYQIAYFGRYVSNFNNTESNDGASYAVGMKRQRLVLVNHRFENLPDPVPNGSLSVSSNRFNILKGGRSYSSKLFDIYYTKEAADILSWQMDGYYNLKRMR